MRFDWTISFGNVLSAVGMVAGLWAVAWKTITALDKRLEIFQTTLQVHSSALQKHDVILGTYEVRLFDLVQTVQRLLGRLEASEKHDRTRSNR
jgi:ParB-like chromosome segregation protein Spo0J